MGRDVIDAAVALDVALARQASELALTFDYTARGAAPDADLLPDLTALAARLDPASAAQVVYNGRVTDALDAFGDFAEAVVDAYPEPLRTDMARMLDMTYEVGALLEPGIAMDLDFGPDGMRGRYVLGTTRPAEVVELLERSLLAFDRDGGLMRFGPAETRTLGGLEVRVLPFELQYEALLALAAETDPGAEVEAVPTEELEAIFAELYGRDLRFALAPAGATVTVAFAGSEAALESLLTAGAGQVPEGVARSLARIPPHAQGFVYRIDFGRLMARMSAAMQALVPGTPVPELPATFDTWGTRQGSTWTFGMAMDVAEFVAFVQALEELEPEEPEEPEQDDR
jgi:hypothetical protein